MQRSTTSRSKHCVIARAATSPSERRDHHIRQPTIGIRSSLRHCSFRGDAIIRIASKVSKAELAQARMAVWSATKRPMILTVVFLDRKIVDACNSKAGKPVLIVLPILISVGTEPVAAVVMTLIGEANSNPIFTKGPDLLNEAIVQLVRPFAG